MKNLIVIGIFTMLVGCATATGWQPTVNRTPYRAPQYGYAPPTQPYGQPQGYPQSQGYRNRPSGYAPNNDAYIQQDLAECEQIAKSASSMGTSAVTDTAVGAAGGAALGAIAGAFMGNAGTGAAAGAALGGAGGLMTGVGSADSTYKQAYSNCMQQRGHNVVN